MLVRGFPIEFQKEYITKMVVTFDSPKSGFCNSYQYKFIIEFVKRYPINKAPVVHFKTRIKLANVFE